jgi:hypothetical protein
MMPLSPHVEIGATSHCAAETAESRGYVRPPMASTRGCARMASQSSFALDGVSTGDLFQMSRQGAKTLCANLHVENWGFTYIVTLAGKGLIKAELP